MEEPVQNSPWYRFIKALRPTAERMASSRARLLRLVRDLGPKLQANRGKMGGAAENLRWLVRMVEAYARGRYRRVPWETIVLVVLALLYFLMPLDAVPDWLPVAGLVDDAAVVLWVVRRITGELEAFRTWWSEQQGD